MPLGVFLIVARHRETRRLRVSRDGNGGERVLIGIRSTINPVTEPHSFYYHPRAPMMREFVVLTVSNRGGTVPALKYAEQCGQTSLIGIAQYPVQLLTETGLANRFFVVPNDLAHRFRA